MSKIREIIERWSFTDIYYEPEEYIVFERDFDKLERDLQLLFQREKDAHDYILAETIESYEEK